MLQPSPWPARSAALGVWLLAAASVAYWSLQLAGGGDPVTAPVAGSRGPVRIDPQAVARVLAAPTAVAAGAAVAAPAPLASRFTLTGVIAGVRSGGGAAVISIDGQPGRPYRVGAPLEGGVVLQSVQGRRAVLADAGGNVVATLELPAVRR